jgi:hypothetical protein
MVLRKQSLFRRSPSPVSSPSGEDIPKHDFWLAKDRPANSVTRISANRRMILLLLGEKAGMREVVASSHDEIRRIIQGF